MWKLILCGLALALTGACGQGREAANENPQKGDVYVVYVDGLKLRASMGTDTDVIAELAAGTRVVNLSASVIEAQNTSWREVRAGDKAGWVIDRYVVPAAEYDALAKAGELAKLYDYYVVYVAKLNVRAEPSLDAEIVATLSAGARVAGVNAEVVEVENAFWRRVRAGDKAGWLADRYILPEEFYNAFRRADELGKAGDATAMAAAIEEAVSCDELRYELSDPLHTAHAVGWSDVSPGGLKVFVHVKMPDGHDNEYPIYSFGPPWELTPCLYFISGRGLADYFPLGAYEGGSWTADSRYYAFHDNPVDIYLWLWSFKLLDTEGWKLLDLGLVSDVEGQGEVEFFDGHVVWLDQKIIPYEVVKRLPVYVTHEPALRAYEISTGKSFSLLAADMSTVKAEEHPRSTAYGGYHEVKLVPAGNCPPALTGSKLYKKYNGAYVWALSSSA
jgi:SH3-like domain-containing protein